MLVINKIDTVEKEALLPVIAAYQQEFDFDAVIPISAKWRDGVAALLKECEKYAQPGPMLFPEDMVTDMPEKQVMAEIIREKLLWNLEKEIPHGTAVEIQKFSERDDGIIDIDATIYCEKGEPQGHHHRKAGRDAPRKISSQARADCERFMGTKVYLQTWVRVKGKLARQSVPHLELRLRRPAVIIASIRQSPCGRLPVLKINVDK